MLSLILKTTSLRTVYSIQGDMYGHFIMKINTFMGDLIGIAAKKEFVAKKE